MAKAQFERNDYQGPEHLKFEETAMPKEQQYQHGLRSYGEPRRVHVYDSNDATPRRVSPEHGYIEEHPEGKPGLVGYTDMYREPEEFHNKDGNVKVEGGHVNVGFMNVPNHLQGGGIGRQMFNYVTKTVPNNHAWVDLGHMASPKVEEMYRQYKQNGEDDKGGPRLYGKFW